MDSIKNKEMKILIINGSPNKNGSTKRIIKEITDTFKKSKENISVKIFEIGTKAVRGCIGCRKCFKTLKNECFIKDDVNKILKEMRTADALIVGTPVYYAGANGSLTSLLDRLFYAGAYGGKNLFLGKVASGISVARRAGTTNAIDRLNKYFLISQMFIAPSKYWSLAFGANASDVEKDAEGLQTMRLLAKNIIYLIKIIKNGKDKNINPPILDEENKRTNFI